MLLMCHADDPLLVHWTKLEFPWLALPPRNDLGGWRDPFVIGRPGQNGLDCWTLVIGSGIKFNGGTVLVYRTTGVELLSG